MSSLLNPFIIGAEALGIAKHWRILINENVSGNVTGILELEMYDAVDGSNVCIGGTATASSENSEAGGPYTAAEGFDNLLIERSGENDAWASTNTSPPHWLAYEFASDKEIVGIGITPRAFAGATTGQSPKDFHIQASADGSSWSTVWSETNVAWESGKFQRFYKPELTPVGDVGTHAYWRLAIMMSEGNSAVSVGELELRTTVGGSDVANGGTPTSRTVFSSPTYDADKAFDNNSSTLWSAQYASDWLRYQFVSPVKIVQISVRARTDGFANTSPRDFNIQYSDDGTNWTTFWGVVGQTGWAVGESRVFTNPFISATAPSQFDIDYWSVINAGTGGTITITITTLPYDGGSTITDLEYQLGDPYFEDVKLLASFDGVDGSASNTVEDSNSAHTLFFSGNAQLDTAQSKFGGASLLTDGTNDYIYVGPHTDWDFGTDDFTIEMWVRANALANDGLIARALAGADSNAARWVLFLGSDGKLGFYSPNTVRCQGVTSITTSVWTHIAVTRASGITRIFIDGVEDASDNQSYDITAGGASRYLYIGTDPEVITTRSFNGWIDEVRITKGVARYTGDFTVPVSAYLRHAAPSLSDPWISLGSTTIGDYLVSGLTDGVEYKVSVRAENALGAGTASVAKLVTPTTMDISPPIYISRTNVVAGTGGLTLSVPPDAKIGDVMFMFSACHGDGFPGVPTGWVLIGNHQDGGAGGHSASCGYKIIKELPQPSIVAGSAGGGGSSLILVRGVDLDNVLAGDFVSWTLPGTGTGTNATLPSVTTTQNRSLVVAHVASGADASSGTANPWDSWTHANLESIDERLDWVQPFGLGSGTGVATGVKAEVGATGTGSVVHLFNDNLSAGSFAIRGREITVPDRIEQADWYVISDGTGTGIVIVLINPVDPYPEVEDVEYQLDGGAWVSLGSIAAGSYVVSGLTTDQIYLVSIRAVNRIGGGEAALPEPVKVSATEWTPAEFGSTVLKGWYKGDEIAGSDGDPLSAWVDDSGNANDAAQATGGNRPTLEVAEQNGLNVVRFTTGSQQHFDMPNLLSGASAASVYYVVKAAADPSAGSTTNGLHRFGSSTSADHYPFTDSIIYDGFASNARKTVGNPTPSLAAWRIVGEHSAASDWGYYLDGTSIFSTATNTVGLTTAPKLGEAWTTVANTWLDGWVAEAIYTNAKQTDRNRIRTEGYLAHKWGIETNLTASHVYKTYAPMLDYTAPAAFTVDMWAVYSSTFAGGIVIDIIEVPTDGRSEITLLEYRVDGGSWTTLSGITAGTRLIQGLTEGVEVDIELRATNPIGAGATSDTKAVTPTAGTEVLSFVSKSTTNQTGTTVTVSWNNVVVDEVGAYSGGTPTRLTVPSAWNGRYGRINYEIEVSITASAGSIKGGSSYLGRGQAATATSGSDALSVMSAILPLATGDYYEVNSTHTVSQDVIAGSATWMQMELLPNDFTGALVHKTSNQAMSANVQTVLTFDSEVYDLDNYHDNVTNSERMTVGAGLWRVTTNILGDGTGDQFVCILRRENVDTRGLGACDGQHPATHALNVVSAPIRVESSTWFNVIGQSTAASNILNNNATWFQLEKLRDDLKYCLAYRTEAQDISSSLQAVRWTETEVDVGGWRNPKYPSRFYPPESVIGKGIRIVANLQTTNTTGRIIATLRKNGVTFIGLGGQYSESAGTDIVNFKSGIIGDFGLGDYFEVHVATTTAELDATVFTWASIEEVDLS